MKTIALLLSFLLADTLCQANTLGRKLEYLSDTSETSAPTLTVIDKTVTSGQVLTFGPGPVALQYYWSTDLGRLEPLAVTNNYVRYTAPIVSTQTEDSLYLWISNANGRASDYLINVTVLPSGGGNSAPGGGQITGTYAPSSQSFAVGYTFQSTVTRAWVYSSLDGVTFVQIGIIDPVTAGNRNGNLNLAVPGSGSAQLVYFRLRTQVGTATPVDSTPITVSYTPIPPQPKSSEMPAAPRLVINGNQVARPYVDMFWGRVNDSLLQDNVNYYEVERASNSGFTNSTLVNAGNTAAGQNIFEDVFYTSSGLADNTTYYFRVRAVNNVGTGPWSEVKSIAVNIQDPPVFDVSNPVFPANGATSVTKTPALEVHVSDPDGDPLYVFFELAESPTGPWSRFFGHGGQPAYLNVSKLDSTEWGSNPLKPNTHYYWRARAQEEGRFLDYYGGTWPLSPVWEFTTANLVGSYVLSNVSLVSGQLRPNETLTYRVTVTNNGNERSEANNINAYYVKNGTDNPFRYYAPGYVPPLDVGQSVTTDVGVRFQDSVITYNGQTYDNVLVTGPGTLRFKSSPSVIATPQASVNFPINYANQGGPTVNWQIRSDSSNKLIVARGGKFTIGTSIVDDIRTSRVLLEYRLTGTSPWTVLDDYTGNTTYYVNFQAMSHTGSTVPTSQGGVEWSIAPEFTQTSTMQLKLTAFDDAGATTVVMSELMTVLDGTLTVNAGAAEFAAYRVGDQVRFPLSVIKAPGMRITNVNINYWYGLSSAVRVLDVKWLSGNLTFSNDRGTMPADLAWAGADGINVPPIVAVTIPAFLSYAVPDGYFKVRVQGVVDDLYFSSGEDVTDGTISTAPAEIAAPFHHYLKAITPAQPAWPVGSTARSTAITPTGMDWLGDSGVHLLYRVDHGYLPAGGSSFSYITDFYHVYYDRAAGTFTQTVLSSAWEYDDLEVVGSTAYLLLRSGTTVAFASMSGSTMSTPQNVLTMAAPKDNSTAPEFCKVGSELYIASSTRNTSGGGGSSTWRSRVQRVLPSVQSYVEQPAFYGDHVDYGSYLNTDRGMYALGTSKNVASQVASWSYIGPTWFSSTNPDIVGARSGPNPGTGAFIVDLYSPAGVATRWNASIQNAAVTAFPDVTFGIGMGVSSGPVDEAYKRVVVRRNNSTGSEERIKFEDFNEYGRNSALSPGKWAAIASRDLLTVGNMSGDLVAPSVQITTTDSSFVAGQSKALAWTLSDNLGQLASLKLFKIVGGVATPIGSYFDGVLPTSLNYKFTDTVPSLIFRLEAYDTSGNRGVAEKVLTRAGTFSITSFSSSSYTVAVGTASSLTWMVAPADSFRVYNVLVRPHGTTPWNAAARVAGSSHLLDTTLMSGSYDVRLESAGVTKDLPQVLTVTGNRFAFDNAGFSPASGSNAQVSQELRQLHLNWGSNQSVSPAVEYSVLGRWNGVGSYVILGNTQEKSLTVDAGSNTSLEWKVVALWQGQEFVSSLRTLTMAPVPAMSSPQLALTGADSQNPVVSVTWPVISGVEGYVVFRNEVDTDVTTEVGRGSSNRFDDVGVNYGVTYAYSVASIFDGAVSTPGAATQMLVKAALPLGITFVNADYALLPGNSTTVQWNAVLPNGATSVFQSYDIVLRTSEGVIARVLSVGPASGAHASTSFAALAYNQAYVCEITARDTAGQPVSATPASLHFTTGFDTRSISRGPTVSVPSIDDYGLNIKWTATTNSEFYDVFRSTNNGALELIGRSYSTTFYDSSATIGASLAYVIRARNGNAFADSSRTAAVMRKPAFVTRPSSQMLTAGDALTLSCSISGILPATYKWLLNNVAVVGATSATYSVPSATLANGGSYTVVATTKAGSLTAAATVFVVDGAHDLLVAPNTTGLVKAASGPGAAYAWLKTSTPIADGTDYAGTRTQTLSVKTAATGDEGLYTCTVTASLGTLTAGPFNVLIAQIPVLTTQTFDRCVVGAWFTHKISFNTSDSRQRPTKFVVNGLPTGLSCDPITGIISGRARASGPFHLTITASNPAGVSAVIRPTLTIEDMSTNVVGVYAGLVKRFSPTGNPGGRVDVTVAAAGTYSGKLTLGGSVYKFSGNLNGDDLIVVPAGPATFENIILRAAPLVPVKLSLQLSPADNLLTGAVEEQGGAFESSDVDGWRNVWTKATPAADRTGYHTFATKLSSPQLGNNDLPQGSNYGSMTVTASTGNVDIVGRVADDLSAASMTCSAPLGPTGQVLLYHARYASYSGSIKGILNIAPATHVITGLGDWAKAVQPASARSHWAGFSAMPLTFFGGLYEPVGKPNFVLGMSTGNNTGRVTFSYGYVQGSSTSPDQSFTVTAPSSVSIAPSATSTSLSINGTTGFFSGSFTVNPNPRTSVYQGGLVRDTDGVQRGFGYFLLSDQIVNNGQTNATTKMYSGSVKVSGL